ncbi:LLM class flavin-dependent oxidoreductase [Kutzneria sp. CA-103260]|uniref:LLM class flavin-dependent oxidoreductase n=1 Tax=Kutzneria sp. CA-103260 TaxID=2802641 RepID=UPI001BACA11E|nr:LLM class flavin-dependent oxidoreductase [Kutzneria sp. CA-103260]QUQ67056.1 LLM class flavin-dependent oxidoreductase [Kutzneria sp. CA-103260]
MTAIYTSIPPMRAGEALDRYRGRIVDVAGHTEEAGFAGILTFTDNRSLDPWLLAQLIIGHTDRIAPLVAVNPVYSHPVAAVRMINTIGGLFRRRVDLNLVSGGFARHLREVGCALPHDDRYDRLREYGEIVQRMLLEERPLKFAGDHYRLNGVRLSPRLPADQVTRLFPKMFVSGASDACRRTQQALGATRLAYPQEIDNQPAGLPFAGSGVGFGIIARDSSEEAWRVARERFPVTAEGEQLHDLSATRTESRWHRNLADDVSRSPVREDVYWLYPFRSSRTFSPYLVGSHAEVGELLQRYFSLGVSTVILDGLLDEEDLHHAAIALKLTADRGGRASHGSDPL